ncbi:hypothetical protein, partial [Desulfurella sp.]|uniref:hypothetical protein n=1 Tax=Desulfurella sp. TaxID=1962857 RepID=UPI003D0F8F8D
MKFDFAGRINISGDVAFYLWSLKWWPYAISHGLNPFLTKAFWAPFGQNLAWTTSCPSIAILMWPITALFGFVFSYNFVTLISLTLAPYGIYLINKQLGLRELSSIFGALVFFFSSYVWGQLLGHLNLDIVFVVVFLCYLYVLRFKDLIGRKKYIVLFALLLAFQFGISNEIYATFIVFSFFAFAVLIILYVKEKDYRQKLIVTGLETTASIALSVVLLLPYIYYILHGFVSGSLNNNSLYVSDPLNYIIPTPITWLFGNMFLPISSKFSGNFAEEGAYLGLPLIFIIFSFTYIAFKNLKKQSKMYIFIVLFFLIAIIFSFGPYLRVLNHQIIPMPWIVFAKLPFLEQALPTRFTLYVDIIVSIICALWLEKTHYNIKFKFIIVFLAILFLIPNLNLYNGSGIKYPEFISSGMYKNYIKPNENIVVFPTYALGGFQGPLWQQKTDFYFNLSQEVAGLAPEELRNNSGTSWATYNIFIGNPNLTLNPTSIFSFLSYLKKCDVSAIIMPEDYNNPIIQKLIDSLNTKPINIDGVILYRIDKNYVDSAILKAKDKYLKYYSNIFTTLFVSSETFLSKGNNPSNLYPKYLEE